VQEEKEEAQALGAERQEEVQEKEEAEAGLAGTNTIARDA
jgi:hypothetical protein